MVTIKDCEKFIHENAKKYGHSELSVIEVKVNNRLKRSMGRFVYNIATCQPKCIEIAGYLLKDAEDEDIYQVCLHELAHAIVLKEFGAYVPAHGAEFKAVCKRIGCTHTGASGKVSMKEKGDLQWVAYGYIYEVKCPECGAEWHYKSACKSVKYANQYRCGKCNVSLVARKIG